MGWTPDNEALGHHEGYAAYLAADGRTSGVSTGTGFLVDRPNAEAASAKAWRAGRPPTNEEIYEIVPWADLAGWRAACACGWTGPSWARDITIPDRHDGVDAEDARLRDGRTVDQAAREAWHIHIDPLEVVGRVARAAAELAGARQNLDLAVLEARLQDPPASWGAIGRAAGMSRQAARDRWGSMTDRGVNPIEFDAEQALAVEERLRRRDSMLPAMQRASGRAEHGSLY